LRLGRTTRPRLLLAAAALVATGCSGGAAPPASGDPGVLRVLGGVPASEAERGVYVVDLGEAGEQSPGSRVGPFLGPVLDESDLLVETAVPPVTLLGGVDDDVETPEHAVRAGDVLVFAEPDVAQTAADLIDEGAQPSAELAAAAGSPAPVVWVGPTPSPVATGRTMIELDAESVTFTVTPTGPVADAAAFAQNELEASGPPGSPGKPWSTVLTDAEVSTDGGQVVITAIPQDLPGPLLRSLIDQRQLSFLPG
jgi:hypothetical protein